MVTIIATEQKPRLKRQRTSFLCFALLVVAGTSAGFGVDAFAVTRTTTAAGARAARASRSSSSSLPMKTTDHAPQRNTKERSRTKNGPTSSELIARKAALVDASMDVSNTASSRTSKGIRNRVNSFLLSRKKKSRVVQEVRDVDSIYSVLGEGRKDAVYTAVIFHAPYCRACKVSVPLFEELAKQYNKKLRRKQEQPSVRFLSVPVTQDNSKDLQDQFDVTQFPLAHIYDPVDGLVDQRPVLRKFFPGFEERLESVLVDSLSEPSSVPVVNRNATLA